MTLADRIRRHALVCHVKPARRAGRTRVCHPGWRCRSGHGLAEPNPRGVQRTRIGAVSGLGMCRASGVQGAATKHDHRISLSASRPARGRPVKLRPTSEVAGQDQDGQRHTAPRFWDGKALWLVSCVKRNTPPHTAPKTYIPPIGSRRRGSTWSGRIAHGGYCPRNTA